jgi:hypothetical protein
MRRIEQVTDDAAQKQRITLPDGTTFEFTMRFYPQQYGWFITELTYGEMFTLRGMRICVSPNILHQFRNKLPFGIACFSANSREPSLQEDFSSGAAQLYVLDRDEVEYVTDFYNGQV